MEKADKKIQLKPILKWMGGKRQLLPEITKRLPIKFGKYFEPFLGGGAVLFELAPENAIVNDANPELINLYQVVKRNPDELIEVLRTFSNDEKTYYEVRDWDLNKEAYGAIDPIRKAARTVFLNRTCFNGVFRVNSSGHFNVPYANLKNPNIVMEKEIRALSQYFNKANIEFLCGDFEKAVSKAKPGDFVYFDPPYDPIPGQSDFNGYSEKKFGDSSLSRLVRVCKELTDKGVHVMVSDSATEKVRKFFSDDRFQIHTVYARRSINSVATDRGAIEEFIITNYEEDTYGE